MDVEIQNFSFSGNPIRIALHDGKPLFFAVDVARMLEYSNPHEAVRAHCKGVRELLTPSNGGPQMSKMVPEGDVYRLIMRSKMKRAEEFQDWVVEEVLPSIRKTGAYAANPFQAQIPKTLQQALRSLAAALDESDTLRLEVANQAAAISTLTPKAAFADAVSRSKDLVSFREFAKILGTGQNKLVAWLRGEGYFIGRTTEPYQRFVDQGIFVVKEISFEDRCGKDRIAPKTFITGKGQQILQQRYGAATPHGLRTTTRGFKKVSSL